MILVSQVDVHAHLIPRFPESETYPSKASWEDPRPLSLMPEEENVSYGFFSEGS